MAAQTLTTVTAPRRRALFGLLDAEGWTWASVKAFFWFVVIILMLGYIPDRAYYFTVFPTIDVGLLGWSPINLCPPENRLKTCPVPEGAMLPWEPSPAQIALPQPRTDGGAVVAGTKLIYIGGSATAGGAATPDVFVADLYPNGNFSAWSQGPALPAPVKNAAVAYEGGNVLVLGGSDAAGKPTTGAYVLAIDPATGQLGQWQTAADAKIPLDLPEARSGAAIAVAGDGIFLVGGTGPSGPVSSVWKAALDKNAKLTAWAPQAPLYAAQTGASAALIGNYLWVYGGSDANGPTGAVQRGTIAPAGGADAGQIVQFAVSNEVNLPVARAGQAGFTANNVLYLVGGTDGNQPRGEVYWSTPTGDSLGPWQHLAESDLPASGLAGSSAIAAGSNAFVIGGTTAQGVIPSAARANLSPQPPFFQLGLVGATIPALKLSGEIGQQLGYLNAAGAGTINFIILILIGWAFAHKERTRAIFARFRRRG